MESNLQNFQRVYQMLEDEKSKDIYLNRLNFLISKDYGFIKKIVPTSLDCADPDEILSQIPADSKIILYGAGEYPKYYLSNWSRDKRIIGFCSNNVSKQENGYLGYPVISPDELAAQSDLYVFVSVKKERPKQEILDFLAKSNYPKEKIFFLSDSEVDEVNQYFDEELIHFEDKEIFIDAGCYDLETSLELKKRCPGLKKVYAFEPDPDNYKLCMERKEQTNFEEAEIYPFGTWGQKATLRFQPEKEKDASRIDEETGSVSVDVVAIDDFLFNHEKLCQITFIKMDIEGAELESLKGAKNVIQRDRPKLAICIYHKPEDMVQIPLYIKKLVPEYRLYIRHHSIFESETVLYAIP